MGCLLTWAGTCPFQNFTFHSCDILDWERTKGSEEGRHSVEVLKGCMWFCFRPKGSLALSLQADLVRLKLEEEPFGLC